MVHTYSSSSSSLHCDVILSLIRDKVAARRLVFEGRTASPVTVLYAAANVGGATTPAARESTGISTVCWNPCPACMVAYNHDLLHRSQPTPIEYIVRVADISCAFGKAGCVSLVTRAIIRVWVAP